MYWKNAFIYTFRKDPAEAEVISHKLMIRAGMIKKVASGIYSYLPLGLRVIRRIENIIREELNKRGAAELFMPVVVPAELWQESGRWNLYGPELLRFTDRKNNRFCLGPTHEEVVVDIARQAIRSYRDMPLCLYQIQDKFRDEIRPRFGLMRGREFIMKDAYSFHADESSLDEMYWKMYDAYTAIFKRSGLEFRSVEADSGAIGGDVTHEFHVLAESGEDTVVYCDNCDYAANIEKAAGRIQLNENAGDIPEDAPQPTEVATPDKKTIEEVATFLNVKPSDTIKMLVYEVNGGEYLVAVCIRGDLELNESKLKNVLGAESVAIPDEESLSSLIDIPVGFLGAHDVDKKSIREIVADFSVSYMKDCVGGANKKDYHLIHVYPSRDLYIDRYADLAYVSENEECARCGNGKLKLRRGIEVGQIFKLGVKYSKPMNLTYLNDKGVQIPVTMGCYGIGLGRTAAAAIEQNHDKDGIIWPIEIAPYKVAVLCLDTSNPEAVALSKKIHDQLEDKGVDVILDDRDDRPGVKFKDCDLIGFPIRVVIGEKGLKNRTVEVKKRTVPEPQKVVVDKAVSYILDSIKSLYKK